MSDWTRVANAADVPEDGTLLVDYADQPVCLYNLGGEIFATHDTCTHGAASLADGFIVNGEIECPLHQGTFDIRTGRAVAVPCKVDLRTFQVKVDGGAVFLKD